MLLERDLMANQISFSKEKKDKQNERL